MLLTLPCHCSGFLALYRNGGRQWEQSEVVLYFIEKWPLGGSSEDWGKFCKAHFYSTPLWNSRFQKIETNNTFPNMAYQTIIVSVQYGTSYTSLKNIWLPRFGISAFLHHLTMINYRHWTRRSSQIFCITLKSWKQYWSNMYPSLLFLIDDLTAHLQLIQKRDQLLPKMALNAWLIDACLSFIITSGSPELISSSCETTALCSSAMWIQPLPPLCEWSLPEWYCRNQILI